MRSEFVIHQPGTWQVWHFGVFSVVIYLGMEILSHIVPLVFQNKTNLIPMRGKHLDVFETVDHVYININKIATAVFVYHMLKYVNAANVEWDIGGLSVVNFPVSVVLMHIVYDFFYTIFHRVLHNRQLYRFVHKHHHRQRAPTRGNLDAINVHPFEFVVGEYLHLLAAHLVTKYLVKVHIVAIAWFVVVGGILASLNHTRFDFSFLGIYSVKVHDVHHRLPESNYGQYIMLWDKIMGSYKPYVEPKKEK